MALVARTTRDASGAEFSIWFDDVTSGALTPVSLVTGSVAITAAALPLPTGAATSAAQITGNASLTSIDGKLPALSGGKVPVVFDGGTVTATFVDPLPAGTNNIGDVDVLSVPVTATTTRALDYANGQTVTAGASSSASTAITATEICVHNAGTVRAYIRQGAATPTAAVAATSLALEPGEKVWLRHTSGHLVAAIRDGASDAAIRIIPVA